MVSSSRDPVGNTLQHLPSQPNSTMPFHYEIVPSSISKPKLRLFYDTASPFSYLAAVVMLRYQDDANSPWKGKVEMEFVPSDLPVSLSEPDLSFFMILTYAIRKSARGATTGLARLQSEVGFLPPTRVYQASDASCPPSAHSTLLPTHQTPT